MEKNVIVTDENGNITGTTYPRRAKGLVKNGRAEYISDCEIRLLNTHAPTYDDDFTEDIKMSNIINFNAREFKADSECKSNVATRMFITGADGLNKEVYELGDWGWNWTQVKCVKTLSKDTEYLFRFAVTGGYNDTNDGTSDFIIYADKAWDDRYVYPLLRSAYKPKLSKALPTGEMLRLYEISFNSGSAETITFMFAQQHSVIRILPAPSDENYSDYPDMTYDEWWKKRSAELEKSRGDGNGSDFVSSFSDGVNINLSGAQISAATLSKLMKRVGDGCQMNLSGAIISDSDEENAGEDNDLSSKIESFVEGFQKKTERQKLETAYSSLKSVYEKIPEGTPQRDCVLDAMKDVERQLGELAD